MNFAMATSQRSFTEDTEALKRKTLMIRNKQGRQKLFAAILSEKPKLHYWSGECKYGGLGDDILKKLFDITSSMTEGIFLETGAGLSTLVLLAAQPKKLITIAPEEDLKQRIEEQIVRFSLAGPDHNYILDLSENVLPELAQTSDAYLDLGLIDGGHGMPTVFVDFCYINKILKQGGFLAIDDIQLHSVRQLYLLLKKQPGF